jgi:AcrR family transcriptional regulator
MSTEKKIRLNQRQRTRAALVHAAMQAVSRGETPTVESAAEDAGVSRATAYRYFTSQQALLLETSLEEFNAPSSAGGIHSGPVESRVDAAVRGLLSMADHRESYLRTFLMCSMEQWLRSQKEGRENYPVRKGRRLEWLDHALSPLDSMPAGQMRRLKIALSMVCGIEALVVAKDVCRCSAAETEEACAWAANAILNAALESSQSRRPNADGKRDPVAQSKRPTPPVK